MFISCFVISDLVFKGKITTISGLRLESESNLSKVVLSTSTMSVVIFGDLFFEIVEFILTLSLVSSILFDEE